MWLFLDSKAYKVQQIINTFIIMVKCLDEISIQHICDLASMISVPIVSENDVQS